MNQEETQAGPTSSIKPGQIRIPKSLLQRATQSDPEALQDMFSQFLPTDEKVVFAEYLGVEGLWGIGRKSFCCLTDRRVASLRVGAFKEVVYDDGYLEHINSGVIFQPSKLSLYLMLMAATFFSLVGTLYLAGDFFRILKGESDSAGAGVWIATFLVGVPLAGLLSVVSWLIAARLFYRFSKCGLVWWIRQGVRVYVFSNRSRLTHANNIYRLCAEMRDQRVRSIRELG